MGLPGTMLWGTSPLLRGAEGGSQAERGQDGDVLAPRGWESGRKPSPWGWLGNRAELPAGNTQEKAPQQRDFPGHGISGGSGATRGHRAGSHAFAPALTLPSRLLQQTCAVCLEDFKVKEELGVLPCQHAFHRK